MFMNKVYILQQKKIKPASDLIIRKRMSARE